MIDTEFGDAILRVLAVMYVPKGVDPALGIQLLKGHLIGITKNEKKVSNLRTKNKNEQNHKCDFSLQNNLKKAIIGDKIVNCLLNVFYFGYSFF